MNNSNYLSGIQLIGDETNGELWARWDNEDSSLSARRAEIKLLRLTIEIEAAAAEAHRRVEAMFYEARFKVLRGLHRMEDRQ